MLELNAKPFMGAVTQLRALQLAIGSEVSDRNALVDDADQAVFDQNLPLLIDALEGVGAKLALKAAARLRDVFSNGSRVSYNTVRQVLWDIESRFSDHIDDIRLFVVHEHEAKWLNESDDLIGFDISINFPSTTFEFEEAAKCIALDRYTASAFHSMRVLEIGIRAVAKRLDIPDPVTAAQRNWGNMLSAISSEIDKNWPKKTRAGTEGEFFESIYALLEAVRGPWRNATMHVETIYVEKDAEHIFNCVKFFMEKLADKIDEEGENAI